MAFQPAPGVAEVQVRFTVLEQLAMNTFYFFKNSTWSEANLESLVVNIEDAVFTNWLPILNQSFVMREVYARDLTTAVAAQAVSSIYANETGALTGTGSPSMLAKAVARRSGLTGRSARGRIYWAGIDPEQVDNNSLLPTPAAAIVAALESIDAVGIAEGAVPAIISRVVNGVPLEEAVVYVIADWIMTDLILDTRRSRKPR